MSQDNQTPLNGINSEEQIDQIPEARANQTDVHILDIPPNNQKTQPQAPSSESQDSGENSSSNEGQEKIIFEQKPEENPEVQSINLIISLGFTIALAVAFCYLLIGLFMLQIYDSKIPDLTPLLFNYCVMLALRLFIEIVFAIFAPNQDGQFYKLAANTFSSLVAMQAFLFYLNGVYSADLFLGFLYAVLIFQVFKLLVFSLNLANNFGFVLLVFESITWLLIGLKMVHAYDFISWNIILLYYTCIYYFVFALTFGFGLAIVGITIYYLTVPRPENEMQFYQMALSVVGCLICIGACAAFGFTYQAFRQLLERGALVPFPATQSEMPWELLYAGYLIAIISSVAVVALVIGHFSLRIFLAARFAPSLIKQISLKTYIRAFSLKLKAISGNFFKKADPVQESKEKGSREASIALDECVVCQSNTSCFLMGPCGHAVLCNDCVKRFLETQEKCPLCKTAIEKCSHIFFDEMKEGFSVDFAYKIQFLDSR